MTGLQQVMEAGPVIPVLSYRSVEEAVSVSEVLFDSGVRVLEITLRHESALSCIEAVAKALPQAWVGAGTVLEPRQADEAQAAGASFGVSPGLSDSLAEAVLASKWPFLPGVATVSEAMVARGLGFERLKFFPAEASGGVAFLKSVGAVLPTVTFCPTGGVSPSNLASYLALSNVACVGGSWLTARGGDGSINLSEVKKRVKALPTGSSNPSDRLG